MDRIVVEEYGLASVQEGMLFNHITAGQSGVDILQVVIDYQEVLDLGALQEAWQLAVDRHPALRTAFSWNRVKALQHVHSGLAVVIQRHPALDEELFEDFLTADRNRGFDIERPPLMRLAVFGACDRRERLVWTIHHMIIDGRAINIVLGDVERFYRKLVRGEAVTLEPGLPYRPYIEWLQQLNRTGSKEFWAGKLNGLSGPTLLPHDPEATPSKRGGRAEHRLPISEEITSRLREVATRHDITLNTIAMGVWGILLSRYSGEEDVLFGATKTCRKSSVPEAESTVGVFLNTLPVRMRIGRDTPVIEVLKRLREEWLSLRPYEHTPFVKIKEASGFGASSSLFDSLVVFENVWVDKSAASIGPEWNNRGFRRIGQTNFSMTLAVFGGPELLLTLEVDWGHFSAAAIQRILEHARQLLESIANNPLQTIGELRIVPDTELHRLLVEWNQTALEYPRDIPLAQLVEVQVEHTPDAVAVVFEDSSITYRDLNERANQLAHELRKYGAGPDRLVGMCMERSIDMITALLAIIKAGAAYVPLDPYLPAGRLGYMIEDSGLQILITERELRSSLPPFGGTIIEVDRGEWQANSRENPEAVVDPENLALVIYTSGSTGRPKGVQIPRGALINILWCMRDWLDLKSGETLLAVTTISFDIAGIDVWLPLLVGARCVLASRAAAVDGQQLREMIERYQVKILQATPVTWRLLLSAGWQGKADLTTVCTGEAMPREVAAQLRPRVGRLWNLYGPTETTIWSTGFLVEKGDEPVLIGRPVANTQCYILDECRNPVPAGVTGELYIAGDGLARGYLNRPELTEEKFVPNPFVPGRRMYRTGDLARHLPDGNIECLGRTDHQVKIRGFRIELGEIEAALRQHPAVKQAVVVAREDTPGDKRLAAYFTPSGTAVPDRSELRALLKQSLPDYMIPADYVVLEAIPISPNGKIDRNALPPPTPVAEESEPKTASALPRNAMERKLVEIFRQVLGVEDVGIEDDFFDLGGHSLTAVQAISRISAEFGVGVPVRVLFQAQTVAALGAILAMRINPQDNPVKDEWPTVIPVQAQGSRPPLFCVARPNVNALGFLFLSRQLGPDQPVYGLQKQLVGDLYLDFTQEQYEATAAEYIREMRAIQPHGPYFITGFCQGSYIAFEMARQLERQGQQIGLLAILDTWPEENTRHKALFFVVQTCRNLPGCLNVQALKNLQRKLLERRAQPAPAKGPETSPNAGLLALPNGGSSNPLWQLYWPGPDFRPPAYSGKITVFKVARQFIYRVRDHTMGWGNRALGGVEVEEIPGEHTTFLREPHVKVLARKIAARITLAPNGAAR